MISGSRTIALILNAPPNERVHQLQLRLAELLQAEWARIDPLGQLDDHRDLFPEDTATGFEDGVATVEDALKRRRSVVLEWRLAAQTYKGLLEHFDGRGCTFVVVTIAPSLAVAIASTKGREMAATTRLQIRRFYERECHRLGEGLVIPALDADPDVAATSIVSRLRDQRLLF